MAHSRVTGRLLDMLSSRLDVCLRVRDGIGASRGASK